MFVLGEESVLRPLVEKTRPGVDIQTLLCKYLRAIKDYFSRLLNETDEYNEYDLEELMRNISIKDLQDSFLFMDEEPTNTGGF
jgi:hypothetical protein